MKRFEETLRDLKVASQTHDAVLVAYSGGKDAMATMDLCCRSFRRVEGFYLYLVPGLEHIEDLLEQARKRWGVVIRQYPNFTLRTALVGGIYCFNHRSLDSLPPWKRKDAFKLASLEAGIPLIATGAKRADSLERRLDLGRMKELSPLAGWRKFDVLAYLKLRGITPPDSAGQVSNGVGLDTVNLLWLHDTYPRDFAKVCEVFPFAEAAVWRRTWFGVAK